MSSLIEDYYEVKPHPEALFIWGTFGIGKSRAVRDKAIRIAQSKGKTFVEWIKTTREQKQEIFEHPEKFFVLIDIRLSEYDSSDIKGLPVFMDDKLSIEFKVPFWALFLENPKSDGILLFDEVNLAPPLVVSSCYKILYDRVINESRINNNWLIIGCGNLSGDRAHTHEVSPPFRDRGGEVELVIDNDEWMNWATTEEVGMRPEILGFLGWKSSALRHFDPEDEQKFTTPRGWERVNRLIHDKEFNKKTYDSLKKLVASAIGEGIATEFVAYVKIQEQIDLEDLIKNPSKIKKELGERDISVKYFVTTAVADKYKDRKIDFKKIIEVSAQFDDMGDVELVAYMWNMCAKFDKTGKRFREDFIKNATNDLVQKYTKYIM